MADNPYVVVEPPNYAGQLLDFSGLNRQPQQQQQQQQPGAYQLLGRSLGQFLAPDQALPSSGQTGQGSDPRGLEPYIRERAAAYGIDPDTAIKVARSEGLNQFSGDRGTSFGAFQLHTGGGIGDLFQRDTGLDPSDPANERATIDYALKHASRHGWGPWYGAARVGIYGMQGIGNGT